MMGNEFFKDAAEMAYRTNSMPVKFYAPRWAYERFVEEWGEERVSAHWEPVDYYPPVEPVVDDAIEEACHQAWIEANSHPKPYVTVTKHPLHSSMGTGYSIGFEEEF